MYKMKSDINFSLTHEMLENEENERIHTSYAQEKAKLESVSKGGGAGGGAGGGRAGGGRRGRIPIIHSQQLFTER